MRAVGGADAPDPLAEFDTWRGTEPDGRVKTEREYVENPYRTLTLSLSLPPQSQTQSLAPGLTQSLTPGLTPSLTATLTPTLTPTTNQVSGAPAERVGAGPRGA